MAFAPIVARHHGVAYNHVIHRIREAGAVRRDRACPLADLPAGQRRQLDRLVDRGVVRRTAAGSYYLDRDAWSEYGWQNRRLAFSIFVVAAGLVAGIVLTSA